MVLVSGGSSAEVPRWMSRGSWQYSSDRWTEKKRRRSARAWELQSMGHGAQRMKCFMWDKKMYSNLEPRVCVIWLYTLASNLCNDCAWENVACGRCICLHTPSIAKQEKCQEKLFSPGWGLPRIPTSIRLPVVVLVPVRGWRRRCWSGWMVKSPSCSRINCVLVLIEALEWLFMSLSELLCKRGIGLFPSPVLSVYSSYSLLHVLCFIKIRALIRWSLNTLSVQRNFPGFIVPTSFFNCSHVRIIFQCNYVILFDLLLRPPDIWQRLAVFVIIVPSFQNGFVTTTFVLSGFPQHIMCFVVRGLPQRWSMSGTVGRILFDDVAGHWQDVVSCLVQLSIPFGGLHAFAACAVDIARFPI